jgi:hypothetical protein
MNLSGTFTVARSGHAMWRALNTTLSTSEEPL